MPKTYLFAGLSIVAAALLATSGCGSSVSADPSPQPAVAAEIREALLSGASASGGTAAAASTGTGWGTLRGQFVFAGDPPARSTLDVNRDTLINATDLLIVRDNATNLGTMLALITPGGLPKSSAAASGEQFLSGSIPADRLAEAKPLRSRAIADSDFVGEALEESSLGDSRDAAILYLVGEAKRRVPTDLIAENGTDDLESLDLGFGDGSEF